MRIRNKARINEKSISKLIEELQGEQDRLKKTLQLCNDETAHYSLEEKDNLRSSIAHI